MKRMRGSFYVTGRRITQEKGVVGWVEVAQFY